METKEKYLEQAEIKVKNLLSDLYESESDTLKETGKIRDRLNQKISDLKEHYSDITKQRTDLQEKFNQLKKADDTHWEKAKEEFEVTLNYVEGNKDNFIQKAEALISELGNQIQEIEEKAVSAASDVKDVLGQKVNDLKDFKGDLQEKLDKIKNDSGDKWKEIKHWFIEKSKSVKEYISHISV